MLTARIILVPGLLGFQRLGPLTYFTDVETLLGCRFRDAGVEVRVTTLDTPPTSSLQDRAAALAEEVSAETEARDIHLVGHSTGGLDCRLMVSPGVSLPTDVDVEAAAQRIRSVIAVSSPHYGSPLASVVTGVHGQRIMGLLSRMLTQLLRMPGPATERLVHLSKLVLQFDRLAGLEPAVCDHLRDELRDTMEREGDQPDDSVVEWLGEIAEDTSLLAQLTPPAAKRLFVSLRDRPGVRRGSVITQGPPPRLGGVLGWRVDRQARITASVYGLLHRLAGRVPDEHAPDAPNPEQREALIRDLGSMPEESDNDGFVPTRSQVWGSVVAAVKGDHLDLMGYFGDRPDRPGFDMLASGAPFDWHVFEETWRKVSKFMLDASSP